MKIYYDKKFNILFFFVGYSYFFLFPTFVAGVGQSSTRWICYGDLWYVFPCLFITIYTMLGLYLSSSTQLARVVII